MIQIDHLHKAFGKNQVLRGLHLTLYPGRITAVLGPNGSGKTTLIKSILGMVLPDQGAIVVDGQPIQGQHRYRQQISYLPQIARFPENLTVAELLRMVQDLRDHVADPAPLIERFQLQAFLGTRLGHLSGGTRQKVNLVQAFMYDTPILVLDEPTSGLDPVALQSLKALILAERAKGKLVLLTSHIMGFVEEMADDIVFLLEGHIHFQGTQQTLKQEYGSVQLEAAIASLLSGNGQAAAKDVRQAKPSDATTRSISPFRSLMHHQS